MNKLFNNPQNWWGKWLSQSQIKQSSLFAVLIGLAIAIVVAQLWQQWQLIKQSQQQLVDEQRHFSTQMQLWRVLHQRVQQQNITPDLAGYLPTINQQIQQLAQGVLLQRSEWQLNQQDGLKPLLTLQLASNYAKMREFLTAVLEQTPLKLLSLHIERLNEPHFSIQTEMQWQLFIDNDKNEKRVDEN